MPFTLRLCGGCGHPVAPSDVPRGRCTACGIFVKSIPAEHVDGDPRGYRRAVSPCCEAEIDECTEAEWRAGRDVDTEA